MRWFWNRRGREGDPDRLDQVWEAMQEEKGDLEARSEEYASWTIPYLCPQEGSAGQEQHKAEVAIGPRLVNHLANRVVDTMFPHERAFFTLSMTPEVKRELKKEMKEEDEAAFSEAVRDATSLVEQTAMRKLKLTVYRPQAVEAVKHMIVTGNALIKRQADGRRIVYGIRDFGVRRTVDGQPYHSVLRDQKRFGSLPDETKEKVREQYPQYRDDDDCILYTEYKLVDGRWHMRQGVDAVTFPSTTRYKPVDLPVLILTWNLARGENYGRGLVEDHTTAFHQINVLTRALIDMVGIMADVKFLVDPSSVLDVQELNNSPRGSYHQGRKDDLSSPDFSKRMEIAGIRDIIAALERELAQAFLLNTSAVRDAERVTAEEIRFIAMELESAFGGLYSRLALEWQRSEAEYAVSQIDFAEDIGGEFSTFEVVVTTGLESLSREGQLDNLRRAIADLTALDAVPEEVRYEMDANKFASFVFTNHSVPWKEFMLSPEKVAEKRQAQMQQEQAIIQMQAQGTVQEAIGKQAAQETR